MRSKFKVGDRVRYVNGFHVDKYRDENGNPGEAVLSFGLSGMMVTGKEAGKSVMFLEEEIELVPTMEILTIKRSKEDTGLKVYGTVKGESGKVYKFGYYRRPGFRGWLCDCESFLLDKMGKKRNCKHIRLVRQTHGRFAASVK